MPNCLISKLSWKCCYKTWVCYWQNIYIVLETVWLSTGDFSRASVQRAIFRNSNFQKRQGQRGGGWCGKSKRASSNLPIFFLLAAWVCRAENALQSAEQACKRSYSCNTKWCDTSSKRQTIKWPSSRLIWTHSDSHRLLRISGRCFCGRLRLCRISQQQSFHVICQMRQTLDFADFDSTMTTFHVCWQWVTLHEVLWKFLLTTDVSINRAIAHDMSRARLTLAPKKSARDMSSKKIEIFATVKKKVEDTSETEKWKDSSPSWLLLLFMATLAAAITQIVVLVNC